MDPNKLIEQFVFTNLLNSDQGGRRIVLQGTILEQPALLLAERGAFSTDHGYLESFAGQMSHIKNLGDNDIYHWYLAHSHAENSHGKAAPSDLKLNLIYPSTDKHIQKYSFQQARAVIETPEIYAKYVRPYMQEYREAGRLNWVFNILDGRSEQENVLFRSKEADPRDDFLLLPDLNWDRQTLGSLHLLALVERRDLWSVRDLKKSDGAWLRHLRQTLTATTTALYAGVDVDMLKFYIHYQPTYYHFHIHIVHVNLDATATQAVGKALSLDLVISMLDNLAGGHDAGMHLLELNYTVGEASELWNRIFKPLKAGQTPAIGG